MPTQAKILIVDDDYPGRYTLHRLLQQVGHNYLIDNAASGPEALTKTWETRPDLILLDVMMPKMDGYEVCRRLRADPRSAEVPIVLVTALSDRYSRLQGIEAGADDFLTKPLDFLELRARVQSILRLNRYRLLQAERSKFDWTFDQSPYGYLVIDGDDHVLRSNAKARDWLGAPILPASLPFENGLGPDTRPAPDAGADADAAALRQTQEEDEEESRSEPLRFLDWAQRNYQLVPATDWADWPFSVQDASVGPRFLMRPESSKSPLVWLAVDVQSVQVASGKQSLICLRDVSQDTARSLDIWKFHHMVAHKFNTPLTALLGGLEVLRGSFDQLSPSEVADFLEDMNRSALRLSAQVGTILTFLEAPTRAESGAAPGFVLADFPALLDQLLVRLNWAGYPVKADVSAECASVRLEVSANWMSLVLGELLENARKFHSGRNPRVLIAFSANAAADPDADTTARFHPTDSVNRVRITFADDCGGVPPSSLSRLMTPYCQIEKHPTGEVPGMGLGLSMVSLLTYEANGRIRISNRPDDVGLRIELDLPQTPIPAPRDPLPANAPTPSVRAYVPEEPPATRDRDLGPISRVVQGIVFAFLNIPPFFMHSAWR